LVKYPFRINRNLTDYESKQSYFRGSECSGECLVKLVINCGRENSGYILTNSNMIRTFKRMFWWLFKKIVYDSMCAQYKSINIKGNREREW